MEAGFRGEVGPTRRIHDVEGTQKLSWALCGAKCKHCGTPQYPYQRVCANPKCGTIDEMEYYRFSDKKGKLFSYTSDSLAFSASPPEMYGIVQFDGGGRFAFNLTDCEPGVAQGRYACGDDLPEKVRRLRTGHSRLLLESDAAESIY